MTAPAEPLLPAFTTEDRLTGYLGDCVQVMRQLPAGSVDAVVTDPPYGLEFMGRAWDSFGRQDVRQRDDPTFTAGDTRHGLVRHGIGGAYGPDTGKAMRAFGDWCETWAVECLRLLKPGGYLLAFGGTRTWHRLACAVEDAGFEVRDSIAWLYGSGFPKSRDVSEAMQAYLDGRGPDLAAIAPEVYAVTGYLRAARDAAGWNNARIDALFGTNGMAGHWTSGASQPLVPSLRQWRVLQAELGMGSDVDALVEQLCATERPEDWGTAEPDPFLQALTTGEGRETPVGPWGTALKPGFEPVVMARKPFTGSTTRNVATYGTGGLNIDGCRTATGDKLGGGSQTRGQVMQDGWHRPWMDDPEAVAANAARSRASVERSESLGRWPTNVALDESQAAELDRMSGVRTAASGSFVRTTALGQMNDDGWQPRDTVGERYGDTGGASRFFYVAKAGSRERPKLDGSGHPTVKPLSLMRQLVRLVTPPGGVVLEPFLGSGTTMEACAIEGFGCIGVEQDPAYMALVRERLGKPIQPDLFGSAGL